jgi:hypothetical protein
MRMFQIKVKRKSEHAFYVKQLFLTENGAVYEVVGKYGRVGQGTDVIIRRMRFACFYRDGRALRAPGPPCYLGFTI